ncbi:peptide/nickel transport system ATP-binding protein [Alicyclobacillus sacchari]|uniref:Peptide/nickel transport system ATP-binding protein n=1 Tax=Alicyclobacillus sacchari TaxID=392010 RepID=A0A4R8LV14_9BACL|nr:ABC transporter ATP-binding protein [Alicyclobacillus sacchari]TDY51398.1 peptide/nickel transport system ATP-binding protein [Alicyclobacillus sacchari]
MPSSPLLQVEEVSKRFRVQGRDLHAVEKVSFQLDAGKTMGLVGESGSGKSTLGRLVLRLLDANEGRILFDGKDITSLSPKQMRPLRRDMQIIFQDPQASMSPRMTIGAAIEDAMAIHNIGTKAERQKRVDELLERVGLPTVVKYAFPHELSGGQLQRVGIARALSLNPKLVICDEPISALDVSIQVQVIQLLQELQKDFNLTYIFISHNLAVVEYLSDQVAVLYLGEVVEQGPAEELFANPTHPYTQVLLQSILKMPDDTEKRQALTSIQGEIPSPFNPPSGCTFHPRCPFATDVCREKKPERKVVGNQHSVTCHLAN